MPITSELYLACERMCNNAGLKPKDPIAVLEKLQADFGITASIVGGTLEFRQGETLMSTGALLAALQTKFPRLFYGSPGEIQFKDQLKDDPAAKVRYIQQHSLAEWEQLPFDEKSARRVPSATIAHVGMRRAEWMQLTIAERVKFTAEHGSEAVRRIQGRK